MQVVYAAENLIDAHLVRGRLEAEGIPAFVRGEFLAGAMGELPVAGLVDVWVGPADAERAAALIEGWRDEAAADPDFASDPAQEPPDLPGGADFVLA